MNPRQPIVLDMLYPLELKVDVRSDALFKLVFTVNESETSDEPVALEEIDLCLN